VRVRAFNRLFSYTTFTHAPFLVSSARPGPAYGSGGG
jgi:hypothetical protein